MKILQVRILGGSSHFLLKGIFPTWVSCMASDALPSEPPDKPREVIILHVVISFNAILSNHPPLSFSHYVQKSVVYVVSPFALHAGWSVLSSKIPSVKFSHSVMSNWLFATPWTAVQQAFLSITNSQSVLKFMPIESVMPSNHLILCCPLLLPPSIFPSIWIFSNELVLHIRWPKCWSFSFSISLSNEYSGLISYRMDWLDLLAVQGIQRGFSITTVQKHQLFGAQLHLFSNSHICTWPLEKTSSLTR